MYLRFLKFPLSLVAGLFVGALVVHMGVAGFSFHMKTRDAEFRNITAAYHLYWLFQEPSGDGRQRLHGHYGAEGVVGYNDFVDIYDARTIEEIFSRLRDDDRIGLFAFLSNTSSEPQAGFEFLIEYGRQFQ